MKKTGIQLLTLLVGFINAIPGTQAACPDNPADCLLPTQEELIGQARHNDGTSLATGEIGKDFIPFFINTGLSIAGTLIFVAFLYAGYLLVFSNDSEENIEKGKKIMIYSIVGAVVMAIAYAVIYGIANLQIN